MLGMTNASLSSVDNVVSKICTSEVVTIDPDLFADSQGRTGESAVTPPYVQTIEFGSTSYLKDLTADSVPIIGIKIPDNIDPESIQEYEKDYGKITKIETGGASGQSNGQITVTCMRKKPTQSVSIIVKGIL